MKTSVALFAFAALLQLSHSTPPNRFVRETQRGILDHFEEFISGILDSSPESEPEPDSQEESSAAEATPSKVNRISSSPVFEGAHVAASELHSSVVTKEGTPSHLHARETQRGILDLFEEFISGVLDSAPSESEPEPESESEPDSQEESPASEAGVN